MTSSQGRSRAEAALPGPSASPRGPDVVVGLGTHPLLLAFNRAGVLSAADVHVALCLARLGGETDELVVLGAAFAVRAPRVGHVRADLAALRSSAATELEEADIEALPWPDPGLWAEHLRSSPLVGPSRPLRLEAGALYLDRYWQDEVAVAQDLLARAAAVPSAPGPALPADALARLFPGDASGEQRQAAARAVTRCLSVLTGGPGTGKTTTIARLLVLLEEQAQATGARPPLVALAAPTGKAAQRMAAALRDEVSHARTSAGVRERLLALEAVTVHRLLGPLPGSTSRFRYHRLNQLPHDVVVIDETSMVPLSLMARLVEAVRTDARLILVGDPQQLASVEAGAVLADIVSPWDTTAPAAHPPIGTGQCTSVLRTNHRFQGSLAALADAVRAGDRQSVMKVLAHGGPELEWYQVDLAAGQAIPEAVRAMATAAARRLAEAAQSGDVDGALRELGSTRALCAHRAGPSGASTWNWYIEQWLAAEVGGPPATGTWFPGRPVIVTANDYELRLFNGDMGVAVALPPGKEDGALSVAFDRPGAPYLVSPARLGEVPTAYAVTVHRGQGSEADEVVVVLPSPGSRILTRELLYTAVTRARHRLVLVSPEESVAAALARPVARASGLAARLGSRATS